MFAARRESFMAFMVAIQASTLIAIECRAVTTVLSTVTCALVQAVLATCCTWSADEGVRRQESHAAGQGNLHG